MTEFTPWMSLAGGILIGLSAVLLMALHGRIAGMTAILAGIIPPVPVDWAWRAAFLAGAVIAPLAYIATGNTIAFAVPISTTALVIGGVIVGIGVTYGSGCTSGHGVCGMARLSPRSIVATLVFMVFAIATVYVVRHVIGA
ncbi:YeeE/YedE family protein [Aquibium sp. ELW1220]|uniref:YeeE/YedE family protein n=1 Tax=Aquibium sp. ELW1220 TaxID=2976766 RepID=UPI0025B0F643|nr:YeeE/YedE family protein [Aquibium sp. ELW1220]MDN2579428.1 YeeE/YedE family protein [Aquibium sp. ELW1220]